MKSRDGLKLLAELHVVRTRNLTLVFVVVLRKLGMSSLCKPLNIPVRQDARPQSTQTVLSALFLETVRDYEHQLHLRLEQERSQWAQYRESADREIADLRRRLSEGQEEENLENEMKKVCRKILVCRSVRIRTQDASADLTAATADLSVFCWGLCGRAPECSMT